MPKALITTVPFALKNSKPLMILEREKINYLVNPLGRKLKENELAEMIEDFDVIIAGTEEITEKVINNAKNLKLISRVGIGLDNINLQAAKNKGIFVTYTPDAPAPAVAELTVGLIISLIRNIHVSNHFMHVGKWHRYFGKRISEITIGIIGVGRIGKGVINRLQSFSPKKILINDIDPNKLQLSYPNIQKAEKQEIYENSDVISLHIPLNIQTKNLINYNHLNSMKPNSYIINTSRGGIINENDLIMALKEGKLSGAAVDVFENEPYQGGLLGINNCLLTSHMGSMTEDCRSRMEIEATEEVVRYFNSEKLKNPVQID